MSQISEPPDSSPKDPSSVVEGGHGPATAEQLPAGPGTGRFSRRRFLAGTGGLAVGAGVVAVAGAGAGIALGKVANATESLPQSPYLKQSEPFYGSHQGGVASLPQAHTYFASFDLETSSRNDLRDLLREWTAMSARLSSGETGEPMSWNLSKPATDTGEALGLGPAQLTLTFGFSPTLFTKDGKDRFGLAHRRPAALVDLPSFHGDELEDTLTGGDMTVQACANDPQVAFHSIRQLARRASGAAKLRWSQIGYSTAPDGRGTPRNLMGFKDGTANPNVNSGSQMNSYIWAGSEGPAWMRGGTYLVFRRIRTTIEHWDGLPVKVQEQVFGRHKATGAPLGQKHEFDPIDLGAKLPSGQPVIPVDAHIRLAAPQNNGGVRILRRAYNYNNGLDQFTERWPPWRTGLEYDVGLLFCAYQRDPRTGFIRIFKNLSFNDSLNQFSTHTGSIIVAVPPAAPGPGHYVGQRLLEAL